MVREVNLAQGIDLSSYSDHHVLDMEQYNLFPNITVLVFADMLSVVRARPGTHVEEAYMDVFAFTRVQATRRRRARSRSTRCSRPTPTRRSASCSTRTSATSRARSAVCTSPGSRTSRCRPPRSAGVVNLHRTLEEYLGIGPEDG